MFVGLGAVAESSILLVLSVVLIKNISDDLGVSTDGRMPTDVCPKRPENDQKHVRSPRGQHDKLND